ncbi:methyltransferase-like 26 [Camponotus floridanus]|nr:methyltransferase-like 26 [Camponotus floridanus]
MNIIHYTVNHRSETMAAKKLVYPAANRNKDPILSVLKRYIQRGTNQTLLEISSGSGQHVAHFAPHFPHVTFYPSEYEPRLLESIAAYANEYSNIKYPLRIDVTTDYRLWGNGIFKPNSLEYVYNANMMHIAPFECTIGLFTNVGQLLKPNGLLITYGPYAFNGQITPLSNVNFDKSLRSQDPSWGLRDVSELKKLAEINDIKLIEIVDMPANNKTIIWRKNMH